MEGQRVAPGQVDGVDVEALAHVDAAGFGLRAGGDQAQAGPLRPLREGRGLRGLAVDGVEGDPVVSPGAMGVLVGVGVSSGQRRRRG